VLFGLKFLVSLLILFQEDFWLNWLGSLLNGFSKSPRIYPIFYLKIAEEGCLWRIGSEAV